LKKISEIQLTETVLRPKIDENGHLYVEEESCTVSFNPGIQSVYPRFIARIIDFVVYFIPLQFILIEIYYTAFFAIIGVMVLGSVLEFLKGTTLGKAVFKLQVIADNGRKPTFFTSIKRNFAAPFNLFPFRYSLENLSFGFNMNFNNSITSTYIVRKEIIPEIRKLQMEMD